MYKKIFFILFCMSVNVGYAQKDNLHLTFQQNYDELNNQWYQVENSYLTWLDFIPSLVAFVEGKLPSDGNSMKNLTAAHKKATSYYLSFDSLSQQKTDKYLALHDSVRSLLNPIIARSLDDTEIKMMPEFIQYMEQITSIENRIFIESTKYNQLAVEYNELAEILGLDPKGIFNIISTIEIH